LFDIGNNNAKTDELETANNDNKYLDRINRMWAERRFIFTGRSCLDQLGDRIENGFF